MEEVASLSIFLTTLSSLLVSHKIGIGKGLRLYLLTIEQVEQLSQQNVKRATIHNKMMNIHHKIYSLFGGYNLYAIERSLSEVERFDKFHLITWKLSLAAFALSNLHRLTGIHCLYDFSPHTSEMCL